MTVVSAVGIIRRSGQVSVEGDVIHCDTPYPMSAESAQAIRTLRRFKPAALCFLREELAAQRKCGVSSVNLYPFLHHEVWTPLGEGELLTVTSAGIEVRMKGESVSRYFRPGEIALAADNFVLSRPE